MKFQLKIFCKDIKPDLKTHFDTSNFPEDHPSVIERINKKVLGMMKFETGGKEIKAFVGLRSKSYSILMANDYEEIKACKGIKKSVISDDISFQDYKDCLLCNIKQKRTMNILRSHQHELFAEDVNKVALCPNDDKRIIRRDGKRTYAHGHYKTITH